MFFIYVFVGVMAVACIVDFIFKEDKNLEQFIDSLQYSVKWPFILYEDIKKRNKMK